MPRTLYGERSRRTKTYIGATLSVYTRPGSDLESKPEKLVVFLAL